MKSITKYSTQIETMSDIPNIAKTALKTAVNGIPGPAYISFPLDLMQEEINDQVAEKMLDDLLPVERSLAQEPDYQLLNHIADKLKSAKNPLIIAGNQVIRENSISELVEFARRYNISMLSTLASKGVIPEDHALFITAGNKYINKIYQIDLIQNIFSTCDLIFLVGYDFGEDLKPSLWENRIETIMLNSYYADMQNVFQPHMLCLGDMQKSLKYLTKLDLPAKIIPNNIKKVQEIFQRREIHGASPNLQEISHIMKEVRNELGETGTLCSDIGLHKQYAGLLSKTYSPNTFLCSNVCGTFGFGLPAGLAAKLAQPEERVIVICGDGGFHSTSQDLETAVRYNIPIVIVLLKDNAFGLIKYYQYLQRKEVFNPSVEFGDVDFVKLAHANGMDAKRLSNVYDLKKTLQEAFQLAKPYLIEIPISYKYTL